MSSQLYQRTVPLFLTFIVGIFVIVAYFINLGPDLTNASGSLVDWGVLLLAFALGLGAINLLQVHGRHIQRRTKGQWPFSIVLLGTLLVFFVLGVGAGPSNVSFNWLYKSTILPLGATTYSMWCFWIISGSYRAFRIRSVDATLLLLAGVLVMLGNVPIGELMYPQMPLIGRWIISVPSLATNRGIFIGAALGAIVLGLRTLIGRERGYLAGGGA